MDKSPAYENFMNKMASMQGQSKPKMTATTMKIGGNGLEKRVANNERKITAIKNIFKAQKINVGEKIKPSNSPVEILTQTNETLLNIKNQLELDFISSKKAEEDRLALEKKLLLKDTRDKKETDIETVKKNNKFVRESKKKILNPFQDIFSKLKQLVLVLGSGFLINNVVNLLSKPEFVQGIQNVFNWTTKNWKVIAGIGATLAGLKIFGVVSTLFGIAKTILLIVTSKAFIAGALFLLPALYDAIPETIKIAITELEAMGGITKENRRILKEQLIAERESLNPILNSSRIFDLNEMIEFLDFGIIKNVKFLGSKVLDFDLLESGVSLNDAIIRGDAFQYNPETREGLPANKQFHDGGFNPNGVGIVHGGEFVLNKDAVRRIGLENLYRMNNGGNGEINIEQLEPIDMRSMKTAKKTSMNSATSVEPINPINSINPYMSEVPTLFGFNDLVYT